MSNIQQFSAAAVCCLVLSAGCGENGTDVTEAPLPKSSSGDRQREQRDEKAPPQYNVKLETSQGEVVIAVHRDWAPRGADRFYTLVKNGYYDGCRFFRVVEGFVAQFGMTGDPEVNASWQDANIPDDPVKQSNVRGTITFAKSIAPNSRTTQVFINLRDNSGLDPDGFSPFGEVIEGMDVVDSLYAGYGDGPPRGTGPDQGRIAAQGNAYLDQNFPKLDHIKKATIVEPDDERDASSKE